MSELARHPLRTGAVLGALGAVLVTGCGAPAPRQGAHAPAPASGAPSAVPPGRDVDAGRLPDGAVVQARLVLRDDTAVLRAHDVAAINTPGSPEYGHYLTPAEVRTRYGPPAALVAGVQRRLQAAGLTTQWTQGDAWLTAAGPVRAVERTFGVAVEGWRRPDGSTYYQAVGRPQVPAGLDGVVGVDPITTRWGARTAVAMAGGARRLGTLPGSVPAGGLTPDQLVRAYDATSLRAAGLDGTGITVTFVEFDGFDPADLAAWAQKVGLPPFQVTNHALGAAPPPGIEAPMDLEVVHAIAPGAKLEVYTVPDGKLSGLGQAMERAIADHPGSIQSDSWGGCEDAQPDSSKVLEQIAEKAAATGVTILASSGDSAGLECIDDPTAPVDVNKQKGVSLPASEPSVTGVGGTQLSINTDGSWHNEVSWIEAPSTNGTGGGVSIVWPRPSWQTGKGTDTNAGGHRQVPDVAADAADISGLACFANKESFEGNGTSQAAPIWAGVLALVNQGLAKVGKPAVGFLNPKIYAIAANPQPDPALHDVSVGGNLVFDAQDGYDPATGLGSPIAAGLLADLAELGGSAGGKK